MLFSIIVPVYNKETVLKRAINSILNQTYREYEVIIVDDGSSDDSLKEINKFSSIENIKIIHQENKGVSVARNTGIQSANGDCITFLDPDDEWKDNHLEVLFNCYKRLDFKKALYSTSYDINMIDGSVLSVLEYSTKKIIGSKEYGVVVDIFSIYNKFKYAPIHTNSIMIPKDIFNEVGYFTVGCKKSQDIDMWFRVLLNYPAVLIGESTTIYHREESTATATQTRNFQWPFFRTVDYLLEENKVRKELEPSVIIFIDQLRISMTKHLLMMGNKKEARSMLNKVREKEKYRLQYLLIKFLELIPSALIRKYYFIRNMRFLAK